MLCYIFSDSCSVPDGDSVLLSGGFDNDVDCFDCSMQASSKVHRYTQEEGWVEDLPDLTVGRYGHGCAAFTMNQEQVRIHRHYYSSIFYYISDLSYGWRM